MSLALALILDAVFGEPRVVWAKVPHPAVAMGRVVAVLERWLNRGHWQRCAGVLALAVLVGAAGVVGWAIAALPLGWVWETLLAAAVLAHRSLVQHVRAVAQGLATSLAEGRDAVAMIVGRDVADMDEPAVARAAIESAAENLGDGVIAPAFWFVLAGLPGMLVCKAVNTADSMIGYRNRRFERFGWAAARFDDALNWVPARLTAGLILLVHNRALDWPCTRRDARTHRSPNAGWPEAAMALVLGVALSGPRSYGGVSRDFAWINPDGSRHPGPTQIEAACRTLWRVWALTLVVVLLIAGVL